MAMRTLAWVLLAAVALGGCSAEPSERPPAPDASRVAFIGEGDNGGAQAKLVGLLQGDAATGCLWLEMPDGHKVPLFLRMNDGLLDVKAEPPAVTDRAGIVAAVGDTVEVVGGSSSVGAVDPCDASSGQPFVADGIRRASAVDLPPQVKLEQLRRVCSPDGGLALSAQLTLSGARFEPVELQLEVFGAQGETLTRRTFQVSQSHGEIRAPVAESQMSTEWNVLVSFGEQVIAQDVVAADAATPPCD